MSIHDFHSKLANAKEKSVLYDALRRLRLLDQEPASLFASAEEDQALAAGWMPWYQMVAATGELGAEA